ncbi:MAG TPA: hypothetical protein VFU64_04335 [Gaiellaceae bacterium]|nr:hypothetical protein [Gaiellaceae bacterium]
MRSTAGSRRLDASIDDLRTSFARTAEYAGVFERTILLAGAPIRLCFAGEYLSSELGRAFAHLAAESDESPELTIYAWDSSDPRAAPPALPVLDPGSPRGTTVYSADEDRELVCRPELGQLTGYDRGTASAWFWCRDGSELPFWERAAPFRQIFHWWLPQRKMLLLHAAAVGQADGGLLLVGAGGSGKSTSALSSLASELLYAGDDYVAVELGEEPRVVSLYCSGKLEPGHARLFEHLPPPSFVGDGALEEKSVFYVAERFPDRMCGGFPLRAIVAPRVQGGAPRVAELPAAQALAALAPSTLLQLVPARQEALSAMAALLQRVPTFRLDVGGPVEALPDVLQQLVREEIA